jgi:hypothetical protein
MYRNAACAVGGGFRHGVPNFSEIKVRVAEKGYESCHAPLITEGKNAFSKNQTRNFPPTPFHHRFWAIYGATARNGQPPSTLL